MKEPFKFDLGVLNFKELKVNCEIAKKRSDCEVLMRRDAQAIPKDVSKIHFKSRL